MSASCLSHPEWVSGVAEVYAHWLGEPQTKGQRADKQLPVTSQTSSRNSGNDLSSSASEKTGP